MEKQIQSFAGTTAGSVLIALGIGVFAFPYAVSYVVKKTTEEGGEAMVYSLGIIWQGIKGEAAKVEEMARLKLLAIEKQQISDEWHEANPDVTTQDIDIPAVSGDPYTAYLKEVGLPLSTVLLAFGDKVALAAYRESGEWSYYGTRRINKNHYYVLVPKGIKVYVSIETKVYDPDSYPEKCQPQPSWWADDPDCNKIEKETFLVTPSVWP